MIPDAQFCYPLLIGMFIGTGVTHIVWIAAFLDYRQKVNDIISTKDRIIELKERLIRRLKG